MSPVAYSYVKGRGLMPDRVEREIEEILAKLDDEPGKAAHPTREPIPLRPRRQQSSLASRIVSAISVPAINPATLLFGGAGIMIVGLFGSTFVDGLIWLSFAGVVLFLIAFAWSLLRRPVAGRQSPSSPTGAYWRDRYIEYDSKPGGSIERVKRVFRKR